MKKLLFLVKFCHHVFLVSLCMVAVVESIDRFTGWLAWAAPAFFVVSGIGWFFWAVDALHDSRRHDWPQLVGKKIIYGCEARGDAHAPYLTRYTLLTTPWWQLCLHVFHRSDAPDWHDHPWDFITLPLLGGYWEETPLTQAQVPSNSLVLLPDRAMAWVAPLSVNFRRAEHAHRVVLHEDPTGTRRAVTLVLMRQRRRQWGFFVDGKWQWFVTYFRQKGC